MYSSVLHLACHKTRFRYSEPRSKVEPCHSLIKDPLYLVSSYLLIVNISGFRENLSQFRSSQNYQALDSGSSSKPAGPGPGATLQRPPFTYAKRLPNPGFYIKQDEKKKRFFSFLSLLFSLPPSL